MFIASNHTLLMYDIQIEFVDCRPGKVYHKYLERPSSCQISCIERLESIKVFDVFSVEEDSNRHTTLKITYKPTLPNTSDCEYFQITTSEGEIKTLYLKGNTLDVHVLSHKKCLYFHCSNEKPSYQSLDLINESQVDTYFQFDNDNKNSWITISPSEGHIKKNETVSVNVTFYPKHTGFIYRKIFCLIRWQEPLTFEIRASYKKMSASDDLRDFIYTNDVLPTYCNSYEDYIQDIALKIYPKSKPLLTFDKKYIYFGSINSFEGPRSSFRVFTLTNHGLTDYTIKWCPGRVKYFRVDPTTCKIKSNSTQIFTAIFEPSESDYMYSVEMYAHACWGDNGEFVLPFPLSINLSGHTLINQRTGWDPFYKLESNPVLLPATVPSHSTSGTFILFNLNKFPLMFNFLPPSDALFAVKPLQGLINNFQIFIARLLPGIQAHKNYIEEWEIELNAHVLVKVKLCATSELPNLVISEDSLVKFPPTNIHSQSCVQVSIKNKTRLATKFTVKNSEPECPFYNEKDENIIGPYEHLYINMYFKPHSLGMIRSFVYFEAMVFKPDLPHLYNNSVITMEGVCSKTCVTVKQDSINLGNVLLNNWAYGHFIIENTSDCDASIRLSCLLPSDRDDPSFSSKIIPELFTLQAYLCQEIAIGICFYEDGPKQLKVNYTLYTDNSFLKRIEEEDPKFLVHVKLYCCLPTLQVADIRLNNVGRNFTKIHFWNMLQINRLNSFLQKFTTNASTDPIYMKLPTSEEESPELFAELLLRNKSPHGAIIDIDFERSYSCAHKLEDSEMHTGMLNKQIIFIAKKTTFQPKEEGIVEIHSNYTCCDCYLLKFTLTVTSTDDPLIKGSIDIFVERHCFKRNTGLLDLYTCTLENKVTIELEPIFVGDLCKPIQVIWIYNNSGEDIQYQIIPLNIQKYRENIFSFFNDNGTVGSLSVHPIMIKFKPYQFIKYSEEVEVITPRRTFRVTIIGEGKTHPCYDTHSLMNKVCPSSLFCDWKGIQVSTEIIVVKPTLLHSTVKRLIFLKNHSNDQIQFYWVKRRFGALLDVKALPVRGVLEPNEMTACQIIIHTLCVPARFNATITCKFTNLRHKKEYAAQIIDYKREARLFDACFGFEDKDEYVPVKSGVTRPIKPEVDFITITVCIHSLSETQLDFVLPKLDAQIRSINQTEIPSGSSDLKLNREEASAILDIFSKVVWEVLHTKIFLQNIFRPTKNYYYRDILNTEESVSKKSPPNQLVLNLLAGTVSNVVSDMLHFSPKWDEDIFFKQLREKRSKQLELRRINNLYYSDILDQGIYQVTSLYSDKNILHERRASDVSRRPPKISFYDM